MANPPMTEMAKLAQELAGSTPQSLLVAPTRAPADARQAGPPSIFETDPEWVALRKAMEGLRIDELEHTEAPAPSTVTPSKDGTKSSQASPPAPVPSTQNAPGSDRSSPPEHDQPQTDARQSSPPDQTQTPPDPLARERADLARPKAEIEAERRRLQQETAQLQVDLGKVEATAADYDRWAKEYERDGDDQLAAAARDRASRMRQDGGNLSAKQRQAAFLEARTRYDAQAVQQFPDLKDPNSEFAKEILQVFRERPSL